MRSNPMKSKTKISRHSTTFDVDPKNQPIPQPLVLPPPKKTPQVFELAAFKVAGWTRLELATSCVTGRRSNQLNYHPLNFESQFRQIMLCLSTCFFCGAYFFSIPINQSLLSKLHILKYHANRQNFPNFALWRLLLFRENFMFDISAPKNT